MTRAEHHSARALVALVALMELAAACGGQATATAPAPARPAPPAPAPDPAFLDRYLATYGFRVGTPRSITPTPGGDAVLFLRSAPDEPRADLFSFDLATGTERRLLSAGDLLPADPKLSAEEAARRERQRLTAFGIPDFQLTSDGARLLVALGPRLFLVNRATGAANEIPHTGGYPLDVRLSPTDDRIAFVRDRDLYTLDLATGAEIRLTTSERETVSHGMAEFVAQEEMDRDEGYWWSPDGTLIAYQRTDEAAVEQLYIADAADPAQRPRPWRYPRAGTVNADVTLAIAPAAGGAPVWVTWDRDQFPYLANVVWSDGAPLTIVVIDRRQQTLAVLAVDAATGATTELVRERDEAWLNLDPQMPRWLPDGTGFLWTTERNGSWQLELRARDGALDHTVTGVDFSYLAVGGFVALVDDHVIVRGTAPGDPTQHHVYRVPLAGAAPPEQLTDGAALWERSYGAGRGVYVDSARLPGGKRTFTVHRADGTRIGAIASAQLDPGFTPRIEITTVEADGRTYWASLVRPRAFDPARRYPVIVSVYGGPHSQMVDAGEDHLFDQWLADHGFIVVSADGRGTPNRGRAWERAVRGDLGTIPLEDQVAALRALGARYPELDLERVGITGWSFGGYLSALAVLRRPDVFHAAVAGAPVTDWLDYDTFYTERYMDLPEHNAAGYDRASALTYAGALRRPLMLVHGTADDNVYLVHTLKLSDALTRAGRDHELLLLAGQTHRAVDRELRAGYVRRLVGFFQRHL